MNRTAVIITATACLVWPAIRTIQAQQTSGQADPPPAVSPDQSAKKTDAKPAPALGGDGRVVPPSSAEDLMGAFEGQRPPSVPVGPRDFGKENDSSSRRGDSKSLVLREGEYLINREGRIERDGPWWIFRPEHPDADTMPKPMRILPNQQLERMVMETKASNSRPIYVVSGEVTLFESQNYILVRKSLRKRATENLRK